MVYVDGFVIPVPAENIERYRKVARRAGKVWMEHGALEYYECVGDDMEVPAEMNVLAFPKMAKAKPGETVVFSFILYTSRAHRDRVNKKVMADPRMAAMEKDLPQFDYKRMAYGGFKSIVALK